MAAVNHQFLLVTVEPTGSLAGPAFALPHNSGRRLRESIEESSVSHIAVSSKSLYLGYLLTAVTHSH